MPVLALLLVALLLAVPAAARAGTAELGSEVFGYGTVGELVYRAAPGERNDVTVSVALDARTITVADAAGIRPGRGCRAAPGREVSCTLGIAPEDFGGFWSAKLRLGDRADVVHPLSDIAGVTVVGGPGNDTLWGGRDHSVDYARLVGGPGRDVMRSAAISNLFDEGTHTNGSDTMKGDGGWVEYGRRVRPVVVRLDGERNDGERGERDLLGRGVGSARGGAAADRLIGDARRNELVGGPGADVLMGGKGDDSLIATQVPDEGRLPGTGATAGGADALAGGPGDDLLEGSGGANVLAPGSGADEVWTRGGADRVRAADGRVDEIRCSGGRERVTLDAIDFWRGCPGLGPGGVPVALSMDAQVNDSHPDPTPDPFRAFVSVACSGPAAPACSGDAQVLLDGRMLGTGHFAVDPANYDVTLAQVPVSQADFPLLEARDPRLSIVVTRAGATSSFSASVAQIGDSDKPPVARPPHPF